MFLHRKLKNRRLGREQVLDVKLRSSQVRATRARVVGIVVGGVIVAGFGGFLLWRAAEAGLNHFFYDNPQFAIQNLEIRDDGVIPIDQLRRWTGVRTGENLLRLDVARVKRDLEMVSLIQTVAIERILPHTLRIQVTERTPIAQINLPRPRPNGGVEWAVYFLDDDGVVIMPLDPRERVAAANPPADALPLISGVKPPEVRPGRRLDDPQVLIALQLVQSFEHSSMAEVAELKRLDVSSPEVLLVTTGQGGEITFALRDLPQQLRRWREIHNAGQRLGKAVATLDLAVSNNIPARWIEASAVPPMPPKPLKSSRNAKKHV